MGKLEIEKFIHGIVAAPMPERITGNEQNPIIAERLEPYVREDRQGVVELLRGWISVRVPAKGKTPEDGKKVGALFLALTIAKTYSLVELRPDIEALIADIRAGKTYLPYYADMVDNYLKEIH